MEKCSISPVSSLSVSLVVYGCIRETEWERVRETCPKIKSITKSLTAHSFSASLFSLCTDTKPHMVLKLLVDPIRNQRALIEIKIILADFTSFCKIWQYLQNVDWLSLLIKIDRKHFKIIRNHHTPYCLMFNSIPWGFECCNYDDA